MLYVSVEIDACICDFAIFVVELFEMLKLCFFKTGICINVF